MSERINSWNAEDFKDKTEAGFKTYVASLIELSMKSDGKIAEDSRKTSKGVGRTTVWKVRTKRQFPTAETAFAIGCGIEGPKLGEWLRTARNLAAKNQCFAAHEQALRDAERDQDWAERKAAVARARAHRKRERRVARLDRREARRIKMHDVYMANVDATGWKRAINILQWLIVAATASSLVWTAYRHWPW